MQPFKMMVGDMVNEKQKTKAYSIQSFLCNLGSVVGYMFPYIFTYIGVQNTAEQGVIPNSVIYSFYIGAAILIGCVIYTTCTVKEYSPEQLKAMAEAEEKKQDQPQSAAQADKGKKPSILYTFVSIGLVQFFCWAAFMYMWTYSTGAIAEMCWGTTDTLSQGYQEAGNWNGVCYAVQAVGSVVWAACIPMISKLLRSDKLCYGLSLVLGGVGFISMLWINNPHLLWVAYLLVGCGWAAILAFPFIFFTNALQGNPKMGTYLGLFNCTICLPQIIAAVVGGFALHAVGSQVNMLAVAGALLIIGALCVAGIKRA